MDKGSRIHRATLNIFLLLVSEIFREICVCEDILLYDLGFIYFRFTKNR